MINNILKVFKRPTLDERIRRFEELASDGSLGKTQKRELGRLTNSFQRRYTASMFELVKLADRVFSRGTPNIEGYAKVKYQYAAVSQYLKLKEVLRRYNVLPKFQNEELDITTFVYSS